MIKQNNSQQGNRGDNRKIHLRLAAHRINFSKKQKTCFQIRSMGVCVPVFRSVSFFVWSGCPMQSDQQTYIQVTKRKHTRVDFDNYKCMAVSVVWPGVPSALDYLSFIPLFILVILSSKYRLGYMRSPQSLVQSHSLKRRRPLKGKNPNYLQAMGTSTSKW